jgi:hypothetical protein
MKSWWMIGVVCALGCGLQIGETTKRNEPTAGPPVPADVSNKPASTQQGGAGQADTPPAVPKKEFLETTEVSWQGDVGINVKGIKVFQVDVLNPDGSFLLRTPKPFVVVVLVIHNRGDKPFAYRHPLGDQYALHDELNNDFNQENGDQRFLLRDELRNAVVQPQQNISDILVFSADNLNKGLGKSLILELRATHFGGTADQIIKFQYPQSQVTNR